jgi:hypothetical protein
MEACEAAAAAATEWDVFFCILIALNVGWM